VRSRGDSPRGVETVQQALAALQEEEFCYVILDQQLPLDRDVPALVIGGERVATAIRKLDRRRTEDGDHVTPIIALTGYSEHPDFVSKLFELGMNAYVGKPICDNVDKLGEKIRVLLARAGRSDHALCAALARPAAKALAAGLVSIAIDGKRDGRRTGFLVNGERRELQDAKFVVFLRLVVALIREAGAWCARHDLGIAYSREVVSRIRAAFQGLVPEGFEIIEGDGNGSFRLNPAIVVESLDWVALGKHGYDGVREMAEEELRRSRKP